MISPQQFAMLLQVLYQSCHELAWGVAQNNTIEIMQEPFFGDRFGRGCIGPESDSQM